MRLVDQHSYVATKRKIKRFGYGGDPQTTKDNDYEKEMNRFLNNLLTNRQHKVLRELLYILFAVLAFLIGC